MFEDSLVESTGRIRTRSSRYAAGSFVLETALVAVILLIPYLYPDALPRKFLSVPLIAPPPRTRRAGREPSMRSATHPQPLLIDTTRSPPSSRTHMSPDRRQGPPGPVISGMAQPRRFQPGPGALPHRTLHPPPITPAHPAKPTGPLHVSSGVAAGQLMVPIQPHYPAIGLATRTQGTVVVSALIGTEGRI
jgi:protein TonB